MIRSPFAASVALAAVLVAAPGDVRATGDAMDVGDLLPLTVGTPHAYDPSVTAVEGRVGIVWTDRADGSARVFGTVRDGSGWSDVRALSASESSEASDPVVRFDAEGQAAVVWVETEGLRSRLLWRGWNEDAPTTIAESDVLIAAPSLGFDAAGEPLVAWFEGGAGQFAVLTASPAEGSGWMVEPLSTDPRAFDILPTVIGGDEPIVYWYGLGDGDDVVVRAARRDPFGAWSETSSGYLAILPTNRLPYLYDARSTQGPGAVWVDTTGGGERVMTADPRRPLELLVQPVPGPSGARQLDPDASSTGAESAAFAWREEVAGTTAIGVQTPTEHYLLTGIVGLAQPRLAADGAGALHLVFVSARSEGGTGHLYWLPLEGRLPEPTADTEGDADDALDYEPSDPAF